MRRTNAPRARRLHGLRAYVRDRARDEWDRARCHGGAGDAERGRPRADIDVREEDVLPALGWLPVRGHGADDHGLRRRVRRTERDHARRAVEMDEHLRLRGIECHADLLEERGLPRGGEGARAREPSALDHRLGRENDRRDRVRGGRRRTLRIRGAEPHVDPRGRGIGQAEVEPTVRRRGVHGPRGDLEGGLVDAAKRRVGVPVDEFAREPELIAAGPVIDVDGRQTRVDRAAATAATGSEEQGGKDHSASRRHPRCYGHVPPRSRSS